MTSLEALRFIRDNPTTWARPVSWRGRGIAVSYDPRALQSSYTFKCVPSPRGGELVLLDERIFEEWEVLDPNYVLTEFQDYQRRIKEA